YKLDPESPATVQWTHDGVPLPPAGFALGFPAITAADAGFYDCTISQSDRTQIAHFEVKVLGPRAPVINNQVSPVDYYVSETAVISVGVYGGTYPYTYSWFRDGVPVGTTTEQRISIPNFSAALAGNY